VLARRIVVESAASEISVDRDSGRPAGRTPDTIIVEEPLEIQLNGEAVASTMRTPGHDFELAVGFLWAEGVLADREIVAIRYCANTGMVAHDNDTKPEWSPTSDSSTPRAAQQPTAPYWDNTYNVVNVETTGGDADVRPRLSTVTSACGACGHDAINTLTERLRGLGPYHPWPHNLVVAMPDLMRTGQELYGATGAVHGAAVVDRNGNLVMVREDIGRHNAADKVVGRLLLDGRLPARTPRPRADNSDPRTDDLALVTSGRASFEMVQKAWAGGFTALVAPSGVSNLAVATARRASLTLMGFSRHGSGVIYSPLV